MQITLNAKLVETESRDLYGLVREQGLDPACLVVEYNRQVVKQEDWAGVLLQQGDAVELLNFVGGG